MGKHALLSVLLLFLFVFDASDASFIWQHRKLVTSETPPHDSSPPPQKKPDPNPVVDATKNNKQDPKTKDSDNTISPHPTPTPQVENEKDGHPKEPNNSAPTASAPPPLLKKDDGNSREQGKEKNEGNALSQSSSNETCDGLHKCKDDGDMVACIFETDPKYLVVLIQNNGDSTIKVKLLIESNRGDIEVGKHQTEKINVSLISSESTQLTLTAEKGDCVLHMDTLVPKGNFFLRLPSFDKILTPVNGAYFLILVVLVFGATWACCKLRKKRHDEVPYQELEMALPESVSATNVESAEGWDQGWDDDWDDNVAVKSPAAHHAGSISANGLTSRSSNKDGWENNWDD